MSIQHVAGSPNPVVTHKRRSNGDRSTTTVTVEGLYSDLDSISDFSPYIPSGATVTDSNLASNGDGTGVLTIHCLTYGSVQTGTLPVRTTWRISLESVQTDLKMHPDVVGGRGVIEMWLNTDPLKRYDENNKPQYIDAFGNAIEIESDSEADKYIKAYEKGIENYIRHFPVVEKISYYKTLPGCSMNGNSVTGGTADFSANIDKWNVPAVKLQGYGDDGWFKSGDNYTQDGGKLWCRTEQWTWTPDGSGSDVGWIYADSSDS